MSDAITGYRWERVVAQDNRMAIDTRANVILATNDELCPSFAIKKSKLSQRSEVYIRLTHIYTYIYEISSHTCIHRFRKLPNYNLKSSFFFYEHKIFRKIIFLGKEKLLADPHILLYSTTNLNDS